jgi:hypothetical protein
LDLLPDAHWGYGFPIGGVAAFGLRSGRCLHNWSVFSRRDFS